MDLSIVIPAFNESRKIGADIKAASIFLRDNHLTGEIIVVDDGSSNGTSEAAKTAAACLPAAIEFKVISYKQHRGKGYAIRRGVEASSGEYVMFADSGSCVPYSNVFKGLKLLQDDSCDIAHGSRKMRESRIKSPQSLYRRICSRIFHWFVVSFMKIPGEFTDTQCGFKIYKGQVARDLYRQCVSDGFMFDVEIIMRAQRQGYRIKEFPIEWRCDRDSRLWPARNSLSLASELMTIKRAVAQTQQSDSGEKEN
jgi:dolichyl-phosphate beta-glucosyltransferase